MNICINCKYCTKSGYAPIPTCNNPKLGIDIITGKANTHDCSFVRLSIMKKCMPEGIWFEPKPVQEKPLTFWSKLKEKLK